jgi:CRISPR-associated protein Cas5d
MNQNLINVRVWGDYACFTRAEMKVERVSYPIMTPSAARGILEAIFWKPQMFYKIDSIRVINKGVWTSFRRNEITKRISLSQAKSAMNGTGEISTVKAGGGAEDATQRNMLALKNVEYIITAEVCLSDLGKHQNQVLPKYKDEIRRRLESGKCFHRPSLGVREFSADFEWTENPDDFTPQTIWKEENLGLILYDVFSHEERAVGFQFLDGEDYANNYVPLFATEISKKKNAKPLTDGVLVKPSASFFRAEIKNNIMDCHPNRVEIIHNKGGVN